METIESKIERLKHLIGTDLCDCGRINLLKCEGVCRESHRKGVNGSVTCNELYQVELPKKRRIKPKRVKPQKDNKSQNRDRYQKNRQLDHPND